MEHAIRFQEIDNETNAKAADADFTKALTDMMFNPDKGYYTLQGNAPRQAFDSTVKSADALREQYGANLTPQARLLFDRVAQARIAQNYEGMSRYAAGERLKWISDTNDARIASTRDAMVANWNNDPLFNQGQRSLAADVEAKARVLGWSPETTQDAIRVEQGKAWEERIHRAAQDDLQGAVDLLERNRDVIPGETQVALTRFVMMAQNKAEEDARKARADYRASVAAKVDDAKADVAYNGPDSPSADVDNLKAQIDIGWADEPEVRDRIKAEIDQVGEAYVTKQKVWNSSPQGVDQLITEHTPHGQYAELEAKTREQIVASAKDKAEALKADTAAFALSTDSNLRQMWAEAGDDPVKVQAAIAAQDARILHSGGGLYEPKVMPESQAKAIVSAITGSMANKDDPVATINLLRGLEHKYGASYDRVFHELQDQHMPAMAAVMGSMIHDADFTQALASGLKDGEKVLVDSLPVPPKGTDAPSTVIDKTVSDTLLPLTSTIRNPEVVNAYTQAARTVAMEYIRNGIETDPAAAATRAASAITGKYNYAAIPGTATPIPGTGRYLGNPRKFRVPQGIDPQRVEDGVAAIFKSLDQLPLPDYDDINGPFLTRGQKHDDLVRALQADPHVRTLPGDDGISIMDSHDQPVAVFTWDQVLNADHLGPSGDLVPAGPGRGPSGPVTTEPPAETPEVPGLGGGTGEDSIKGSISEPTPFHGDVHPTGERVAKVSLKNGDVTITTQGGSEGPGMPLEELMTAGTDQQLDTLIARGTPEIATAAKLEKDNRTVLASLGYRRTGAETMSDAPKLEIGYQRDVTPPPDAGVEPDATFVPGAYAPRIMSTMLPLPPKRPGPDLPLPPVKPTVAMPPSLTKPEPDEVPVVALPMPPALTKPEPTPRSMPVTTLRQSDVMGAKEELTWRGEFADYLESMDARQLQKLASIATGTTQGLVMPVASGRVREDEIGKGDFHAPRTTQADRMHHGTDLEAIPGEAVFAPVTGTVTKIAPAYGDGSPYQAVEIFTPDGKNVRLLYVQPGITEGQRVYAGITPLGVAQDVTKKYGKGIKPHVHMEVRLHGKPRSTEGQLVDAWPLLHQGDVAIAMIQAVAAQKFRTQLAGR